MESGKPFSGELLTGEAATSARQQRGLQIAALAKITERSDGSWSVPSQSGLGRYTVRLGESCTCPDYEVRACKCKHMWAVEYVIERETTEHADGSRTVTESVSIVATSRPSYQQNWPAYNAAQTNEQDEFQRMLYDLCANIPTPPREPGKPGRPPLPLSDAVFAVVFKVYSTFSGRRFISDLRAAHGRGYIDRLPHFNSIFNYLENPALTPILHDLIATTSAPLASVECDFAADSSGFSTSRFSRWFDKKYGIVKPRQDWVKIHVMCGVKTNVVTAVEIHGSDASDVTQFPALVSKTAKNFKLGEVSADKGYLARESFNVVKANGGTAFIPFKTTSTGRHGGLWAKMFHFFNYQRETFLAHYHKRSNVESTFSMIKAKFGDALRSKTDVAMVNEALCKLVAHNICCLISAFYELGIKAEF
jgi:transposase